MNEWNFMPQFYLYFINNLYKKDQSENLECQVDCIRRSNTRQSSRWSNWPSLEGEKVCSTRLSQGDVLIIPVCWHE